MNPILDIKLRFSNEKNHQKPGPRNLRAKAVVDADKIDQLIKDLQTVSEYYKSMPNLIEGIVIDIKYNDIIAKSNRVKRLLKPQGVSLNEAVVGARFSDEAEGKQNHIITYYVDRETIDRTITELQEAKLFLNNRLAGKASSDNFNSADNNINYTGFVLSKAAIRDVIIDASAIESFAVPDVGEIEQRDSYVVTFYKTELNIKDLLKKADLQDINLRFVEYGDNTISAYYADFQKIREKVPYLISMVSSDLSQLTLEEAGISKNEMEITIPLPEHEPVIGVIDTLFDEKVYFSKWVKNEDCLSDVEKMMLHNTSRDHGTEVTSIIVDGPRMNPWLDDGCGRFRVRHFGVCEEKISPSRMIEKIKDIVGRNPDIHVWNLSLGTEEEISKNFISYDAAVLDELQAVKNVLFVVSGTNDNRHERNNMLRIGSPADSLNAVVVNSVRRNGTPASYSRKGNVLSFFNKPDVAYYGGDYSERIVACSSRGETEVYGTSFAAPWVSRKLSYLIDVMGFTREVAKALIIDSAAGWNYKQDGYKNSRVMGYGIVPIDINAILSSANDEIRFILHGTAKSYRTSNYAIPVPKGKDDKYPYVGRATLCYFPKCNRAQGVDYTNRELSLKFGRITDKDVIDDINKNVQEDPGSYTDERQSRRDFRKWENTKFISSLLKNNRPLKAYPERLWGISLTSKDRLGTKSSDALNFGAVITLKELEGINRIEDFVRACRLRGWIVNEVDAINRVEVYAASQQEIQFE